MNGGAPEVELQEAMRAIQVHRAAIIEAQHKVLRRELTMPQYNAVYKEHLDAIHALEKRIFELQQGAHGQGGAGLY